MSWVMVTADFPNVSSDQRQRIYDCLERAKWKKVENIGRDISTVWYARFEENVSDEVAIQISDADFIGCSKPYTIPKLAIHVGSHKPTLRL